MVVDDLPIIFPSGPYTSPENRMDRSGQRQQNQLVIFFDADTGQEIEGSLGGRWVDEREPVGPLLAYPAVTLIKSGRHGK